METRAKQSGEGNTQARKDCLKKFLYYFPKGYEGKKYIAWEREYKYEAHLAFQEQLNKEKFNGLIEQKKFEHIADAAVRIESKTNLLFSFEKMALRDAVKAPGGAKKFAEGLYRYIYGEGAVEQRLNEWIKVVGELPRKQTRVLTWPLTTVFGFLGNPKEHIFLKPRVTKIAAEKYHFNFQYQSQPNWKTYKSLFDFAEQVRKDTAAYKPKDFIDLQSFIWVMGSEEYPD
jgi:hypothetical protein